MEQVIIIVGLPASGKTIYSTNNYTNYKLYDDFVTHFFNGKLLNDIKNNINVCINDPRLCQIDVFDKIINKILRLTDSIKLILYKNNPIRCCLNSKLRDNKTKDNENMENYINWLSDQYNIKKYMMYSLDTEIVDVWE